MDLDNMLQILIKKTGFLDRIRKKCLEVCFFAMALLSWSNSCINGWSLRYAIITVIGIGVLYISCVVALPYVDRTTNISVKTMILPMTIIGLMSVSAFANNISNILFPFSVLIGFSLFWYIQSRISNREIIYSSVAKGIVFSFGLFFLSSIVFAPITIYQYTGIFKNCNDTAQYLTAILPCALYLLRVTKEKKYLVVVSSCCTMVIYTKSRTGLLTIILILLTWFAFQIKRAIERKTVLKVLKQMLVIALMIVVFFPFFWGINRLSMYTVQKHICLNAYEELMQKRGQTIYDTDFGWFSGNIAARISVGEKNINEYSTGRIRIWEDYIQELNLFGHSVRNDQFGKTHSTAHNVFIQVAYDYGGVVGGLYIILIGIIGLQSIRSVWTRFTNEKLFSLIILLGYGITAMLASNVFPFTYLITLLHYLTINEMRE